LRTGVELFGNIGLECRHCKSGLASRVGASSVEVPALQERISNDMACVTENVFKSHSEATFAKAASGTTSLG